MRLSLTLNVCLQILRGLTRDFEDLILGFANESCNDQDLKNQLICVPISQISELGEQLENCKGEIIEICASEPEQIDEVVGYFLTQESYFGKVAILGSELSRWENTDGLSGILVANEDSEKLLFAAKQLVQSQAIQMIVISEILLKIDGSQNFWDNMVSLKRFLAGFHGNIVLLNPKTPERKAVMSELLIICSRHIEIIARRGRN